MQTEMFIKWPCKGHGPCINFKPQEGGAESEVLLPFMFIDAGGGNWPKGLCLGNQK